jgi:hypothetical protein
VYNIVDMIAEVSGLADLLIVFSQFILSFFFTKNLLTKVLVEFIGTIESTDQSSDPSGPLSPSRSLIFRAANSI